MQDIRQQWGDWCNIKNAGFGTRPTTNTGSPLVDAFIWAKAGGESDGTSNSTSPRFTSVCALVSVYARPGRARTLTTHCSRTLPSLRLSTALGSNPTS